MSFIICRSQIESETKPNFNLLEAYFYFFIALYIVGFCRVPASVCEAQSRVCFYSVFTKSQTF